MQTVHSSLIFRNMGASKIRQMEAQFQVATANLRQRNPAVSENWFQTKAVQNKKGGTDKK